MRGSGCRTCHGLYEYAGTEVVSTGLNAETEYITDMEKVMTYGVMRMPAPTANDRVVSEEKLLKSAKIEKLLKGVLA